MSKPARDYEKMRPVIMRAISLGSTPGRICAKHMLHWSTLMRHLRKWLNEGRPPWEVLPASPETAFLDLPSIPVNVAASMADKIYRSPEHDPERNERIRQLRREGLAPSQIRRRLGLTRNVVIGVLHRAGMAMDDDERTKAKRQGQKLGGRKRRAATRPAPPRSDDHAWNFSAGAHRNAAVFGQGRKGESTGPINLEKHYEPIPPHAVTIEHLTGCSWPYGDVRGEGIAYCNRPRCRVQVHHLATPILTAYCHAHWEQRRTSKATRIIHDNMQRLNGSATY